MARKRIPEADRPAYLKRRQEQKNAYIRERYRTDPGYRKGRHTHPRKYPDISAGEASRLGASLGGSVGSREAKSRAGKLGARGLAKARELFGGKGSPALTPAPPRMPSLRVPKAPKVPRGGPVRGPDITLGPGESYEIRPFRRQRFER